MKEKPFLSFETERLLLQPTSKSDAAFVFELLNTPKWIEHIGDRKVHSIANAEAYIATRMTPQLEKLGYGNYTVIRKSDSTKMGTCGLYDREGLEGIDIGFAFLPAYEKMGYAFEAASKIRDVAFQEFNISQISAITIKANKSSQRLLEKLGLQFIKYIKLPNDDEELMYYQLKNETP